MDRYKHWEGYNFNVNFILPISTNGWSIQQSNYLRYNHHLIDTTAAVYTEIKKIKTDHFLDLVKSFKLGKKKKSSIEIGIGGGYMNTNSVYNWKESTGKLDINGNIIYNDINQNFGFWCKRFKAAYSYKRLNFNIYLHESKSIPEPSDSYSWWIEAGLTYTLNFIKL